MVKEHALCKRCSCPLMDPFERLTGYCSAWCKVHDEAGRITDRGLEP